MTAQQKAKAALAVDQNSNWGTAELTAILEGIELLRPLADGTHVLYEVCTSCKGNGIIKIATGGVEVCAYCGGEGIHRNSEDMPPEEASQEQSK